MHLFSGSQWLHLPVPLWQQCPLCGNPGCISKASKLTKLGHLHVLSFLRVYGAQTLLLSLSQTTALETQQKIPAIPSSRAEAAMWAGPCTATGPLHHQSSSCKSRLRLSFHPECTFAALPGSLCRKPCVLLKGLISFLCTGCERLLGNQIFAFYLSALICQKLFQVTLSKPC